MSTAGKPEKIVELFGGHTITIFAHPDNSDTVYIGNRNVTSSNGMPLKPSATLSIDLTTGIKENEFIVLYCVSASDNDSIRWFRI